MAKQQREQSGNKPVPQHLNYDDKAFDQAEGEVFGGASEILHPEENQVVGPLTYTALRKNVDLGNQMEPVDIHEARDSEGNQYRLPISANCRRQAEVADLKKGDVFVFKRLPDVAKARGKGAGNMMEMYQIKVLERAAVPASGPA